MIHGCVLEAYPRVYTLAYPIEALVIPALFVAKKTKQSKQTNKQIKKTPSKNLSVQQQENG
jgi:hypothetical protein